MGRGVGARALWREPASGDGTLDAGRMDLEITRPGVVVPLRVDPKGQNGPTKGQARGKKWRRTSHGMYVPSDVDADDTSQQIVEAAAGTPEATAVTGWAALHWQGARWFDGRTRDGSRLAVPLALGDTRHLARRPGVQYCYDWLFDDDLVRVDGLSLTRVERAVYVGATRALTLEAAVQFIDMATASDLVSLQEFHEYAQCLRGRPGTRRLFSAILLAVENAWSPLETTARLRWLARRDVGLLCNAPIFDEDGSHLFTPDLFDPEAGVAGEYDGRVHDETRVRRRDLNREELARQFGIETVSMVSGDLRDVVSFERRLDAAYSRAAQRSVRPRWTLKQPDWWVDTSTVARRRALAPDQRRVWMRWSAA